MQIYLYFTESIRLSLKFKFINKRDFLNLYIPDIGDRKKGGGVEKLLLIIEFTNNSCTQALVSFHGELLLSI